MKTKRGRPVYRNGGYVVLPLVVGYIVTNQRGETVYPPLPLKAAVETCDEIAALEEMAA